MHSLIFTLCVFLILNCETMQISPLPTPFPLSNTLLLLFFMYECGFEISLGSYRLRCCVSICAHLKFFLHSLIIISG